MTTTTTPTIPAGLHGPLDAYTRHMMFDPGCAFMEVWNADTSNKHDATYSLAQAVLHLNHAIANRTSSGRKRGDAVLGKVPRINRAASARTRILHLIADGQWLRARISIEALPSIPALDRVWIDYQPATR